MKTRLFFGSLVLLLLACREDGIHVGGGKISAGESFQERASAVHNGTFVPSSPEADRVVLFRSVDGGDCSGTLITPNHILTAAHCVLDPEPIPGEPDLLPKDVRFVAEDSNIPPERKASILEVFVNPNADSNGNHQIEGPENYADVAILKINRRIPPGIALPRRPHLETLDGVGTMKNLQFTGFGEPAIDNCTTGSPPGYLLRRNRGVNSFLVEPNRIVLEIPSSLRLLQQTTTTGDSGGPVELVQGGETLLIGSIRGGDCRGENKEVYVENHVLFSFLSNKKFILSVMERNPSLGGWFGETLAEETLQDPDEDGIPNNGEDNCPLDYNPDQFDGDLDGLGDVCDPTPKIHTKDQKEPPRNSNYGAELVNYEREFHDDRPITKEDPPTFAEKRALHYQVDEVEKIALARVALMQEPIDAALCSGNNCGKVRGNTRIDVDLVSPILFQETYTHGLRFCMCDESDIDLTIEKGRTECDLRKICPYKGHHFLEPDDPGSGYKNPWRRVHVKGNEGDFIHPYGTLTGALAKDRFHSYSWDIAQNKELWVTGADLEPLDPFAITTRGILWSHTDLPPLSFALQQGDIGPDPDWPIPYLDRSNVFIDGSIRFEADLIMKPPKSEDLFRCPWDFCPHCPIGTKSPFLHVGNPGDKMLAVSKEILFDVTPFISSSAREVLQRKDGFLIPASEPGWLHKRHGVDGWLIVALDADFSLRDVLRSGPQGLQTSGRRTSVRSLAGTSSISPASTQGAALVGASSQDAVFRVGGLSQGIPETHLWKLSVFDGTWEAIPLVGEVRPGKVLTATYRFSDQSLYVVDEESAGKNKKNARLLRIRRSGLVERVATWPRLLQADVTLTVSNLDELVFSFSRAGAHAVVVAKVTTSGKFQPTHWTIRPGTLLVAPRLSERWLTEAIQKGSKTSLEDVERSQLLPVLGACGGLWW